MFVMCCLFSANFDVSMQDVLGLPPLQQHAHLELQLTSVPTDQLLEPSSRTPSSSMGTASLLSFTSGTQPSSAASFLPVLKLLTGSVLHAVRQLASKLLTRRLTDLLGRASAPEASLWLGLLPTHPQAGEDETTAWSM